MDAGPSILEAAREAGFDLAALVPLGPPRDGPRFEAWLAAGHHANMRWLERYAERILDPRRIDPRARTLLVVGLGHARSAPELPGRRGRVARYAAGRDYHNLMTKRLRKLARRLAEVGLAGGVRTVVDAGPLLERGHAAEAGIGFASKAANLLHPEYGPWFFLGELLLDVELTPAAPTPPAGSCGTCTACLDACPTGAIVSPGVVDAGRCLSYHTIENKGPVPRELRVEVGPWVFGCDVCSEVCPWGRDAPDASETFGTHPFLEQHPLEAWLAGDRAQLSAELVGTPLARPGLDGLAKNAALALGCLPAEDASDTALRAALETHPAPTVRAAAGWALARAYGSSPTTRVALERAVRREPDEPTHLDLEASLGEL